VRDKGRAKGRKGMTRDVREERWWPEFHQIRQCLTLINVKNHRLKFKQFHGGYCRL